MTSTQMSTRSRLVVGLREGSAAGPESVGTKAANLARLLDRGFRVPDGFVITAGACDQIALDAPLPPALWSEVLAERVRLGGGPVAVRSSGVDEDLPGASFAGQYETVLGVEGDDALAAAIRRCLNSADSERVRAYRDSASRAPMAVLVQAMVAADAAGVAFTANPVTGDDEVLVSAVRGLGERLVSGESTPDEWVVRGGDPSLRRTSEGAVDADQAREIARVAREVEGVFGAAQDVEWAVAAGDLYVLQARPITALPVAPTRAAPTADTWVKDTSHFPAPLTPFGASVYLPAVTRALPPMAEEFGLLFEGVDQRSIGGEVYMHVIPPGGKDRKIPPGWVVWVAARLAPPFRSRTRVAAAALSSGAPERILDDWEREWRDRYLAETRGLLAVDLTTLDDAALLAHLDAALDLLSRGEALHFRLAFPHALALYQLEGVCRDLLGWSDAESLQLLTGTSAASSRPGRALHALAERVAADPAALDALASPADRLAALRRAAPWAADAVAAYLAEYGHRTMSYDPGDPTYVERPDVVLGLLALQAREVAAGRGGAGDAGDALANARAAVAARSAEDADRFERALAFAQRAYGQREDNVFVVESQPCALLRYAAVEIGRRLASDGVLSQADDAVFLEERELRAALTGTNRDGLRETVARRRAERAWVIVHPGPAFYGKAPVDPPDVALLPEPLRLVNAAFLSQVQRLEAPTTAQGDGDGLRGVPASPGRFTGTVRVVHDEGDFGRLRPGEVLVAPATSPSWSVLFLLAGAVVTDGGGVLSHTAVIAREYGIPAVLATGEATRRLRDGDLVTVDGTAGVVSAAGASAAG